MLVLVVHDFLVIFLFIYFSAVCVSEQQKNDQYLRLQTEACLKILLTSPPDSVLLHFEVLYGSVSTASKHLEMYAFITL